jgi:hypothetical protein
MARSEESGRAAPGTRPCTTPPAELTPDTEAAGADAASPWARTRISPDASGSVLATSDDPDAAASRYGGSLTRMVPAGTFVVVVRASGGYPGRYAVFVRAAS